MPNKPQLKAVTDSVNQHQLYLQELEAWVCSGLLTFWRKALPTDSGIYNLIHSRVRHVSGLSESLDWSAANQRWQNFLSAEHIPNKTANKKSEKKYVVKRDFPLLQLAKDYQLSPAQLFAFALVGLAETSHLVNLAIAELQAPDKSPRICIHLVCALLDALFTEDHAHTPLDISEQSLVAVRALVLSGDVPLPLQRLSVNPLLWSILLGRVSQWPQCQLQIHSAAAEHLLPPFALADVESVAALLSESVLTELESKHDFLTVKNHRSFHGVVVRGNPNTGRGLFSYAVAHALGLTAIHTPMEVWQHQPEFLLACQYARWLPVLRPHLAPAEAISFPVNNAAQKNPVVIILGNDGAVEGDMLEVILETPQQHERHRLWLDNLGHESHDLAQHLSASALLSARSIQLVAEHAQHIAQRQSIPIALTHIAEARRKLGADKLRLLAQPIARSVNKNALVLPLMVEQALDAVVLRACKREALWNDLGETLKVTPNPGVRALFVGESGTGKTLAASYIATQLGAPLYRVDLSAVMNKYIGESEKNLAQLLDHAAANDVVLLFDEADALFGSRGEGQENGERFANMLTNFLLTRIETHPGIVILTTNSRERIDNAFTRRLDSIVEFPLPGFEERLHLWRSHLGERGPGEIVYRHLASTCDLAGGQLRNVVLTAAVYAEGFTISNENLLEGLRAEYRKQGRELPKKLEALSF